MIKKSEIIDHFSQVIQDWKSFWMSQTQNSPQDHENYFRRAIGVDANMSHDLAERCADGLEDLVSNQLKAIAENRKRGEA